MTNKKNRESMPEDESKSLAINEVKQALLSWYDLRFNIVKGVVEGRTKGELVFSELNENNVFIRLLSNGYRITMGNLFALLYSDFSQPYDPLLDYLDSLDPWTEGDPDYIENHSNHVRAKNQPQFNTQFKKMLVRTISCAIDDHSFNKHVFILVGAKQNTGKTTFLRLLCPPALKNYYTETISGDKDGLISFTENLIANLDELSTKTKFELNQFKGIISIETVRVRPPYGRKAQTNPRRISFVGSTNDDSFLNDPTGSVRWLCFDIDSIDWGYSNNDINKVWSQAYALYKSGFKFKLTNEELKENETRNEQYQQVSTEYEYVQKFLSPATVMIHDAFWTTTEIRDHIIQESDRKADIKNLDRLGKALKELGFDRVIKRIGTSSKPTRGYYVNYLNKV
jgi:predicted P-loop ATPase